MSTSPNPICRTSQQPEPDRFGGSINRLPLCGDETEIYCRYCDQLWEFMAAQRIGDGPLPAWVINRASRLAWSAFVRYQPSRNAVFHWLCAVALAEARRLYELES
jgi:hypothetical protein